MAEKCLICSSCGKEEELPTEGPPCELLSGWLIVALWKGLGTVEHYNFCSFTCLKRWSEAQAPRIPKVFLESLGGEDANL